MPTYDDLERAAIRAVEQNPELAKPNGKPDRPQDSKERCFKVLDEQRYRLTIPSLSTTVEIDRLRRDHHELVGELAVRCNIPGAKTFDGTLSIADFNLSSARARQERARILAQRSQADDIDWAGILEEFCQRVLAAERNGPPAIDLRDVPRPGPDDVLEVEGIHLLRRHPVILFGDGGAAKSYIGLYLAGRMAQRGLRVALFDWELAADDHRDRLQRLFGEEMPRILYVRCERPLTAEGDRLRRIARAEALDFAVFDSVAFACDGPPEAAEVAGAYFRTVRQIGCGSLHIAHVSKADGADKKPFGSTFWHNGARTTWYAKLTDPMPGGQITLGLFNRKANLGALRPPLGFRITFTEDRTTFQRTDVASDPDLAGQMTVRQRMESLLRIGAMEPATVAAEIDADLDTITRTARRYKQIFTVLKDGRLALLDRTAS